MCSDLKLKGDDMSLKRFIPWELLETAHYLRIMSWDIH